ncbi:GNAT family N-acetyltransferase [Lichenibacterium dinghuense]|uniref:GNAT family N-acetyltransferase n=1 Tax=Lichenibacterium dinghuense TaxID=2895977 RepID=UPI001F34A9A4|nr:GNAT family N-acetyltransferase [Lichenibacterium sp. 6Y81]
MALAITPARTAADLAEAGVLIREYVAWLGLDLSFQHFDAEIADLAARYAPPAGELLLARGEDGAPLGCVGVKALPARPGACEMKRLYLRDAARGTGAGRALAEASIAAARALGYREMLLDTLSSMAPAVALYRALGFESVSAYYVNPVPGAVYFRMALR